MSRGFERALGFRFRVLHLKNTQENQPPKAKVQERKSRRRGFTLLEAVAAIGLIGIGVASVMGALAAMANTDRQIMIREQMQKLAVQKYDEIIATGLIDTAELSGDFTEENIEEYEWAATVEPSGEENLEILSVTVNQVGDTEGPASTIDGLVFRPPVQGGAE